MWYVLACEALAVVGAAATLWRYEPTAASVLSFTLLFGMSALYGEACDRVERLRRFLATDGVVSNQNSALCFAGVLALPTPLAAVLVITVYAHSYLRTHRHQTAQPHRVAFTASSALLATFTAAGAYHLLGGQLDTVGSVDVVIVISTLFIYTLTNLVILMGGIYLMARPDGWQAALPGRQQVTYETSTLLLGVLGGILLVHATLLAPLVLVLVAILHRASLVTDLQQTARTDSRTGLLTSGAWHQTASQQLARSLHDGAPAALLLIDLDFFKRVNDNHGHLAGDAVLRAVADALTAELRGYDAVGRYGGEEFIALLPATDGPAAVSIAERLRRRIGATATSGVSPVTASVGIALTRRRSPATLEELIRTADTALYQAKIAGRDQVAVADLGNDSQLRLSNVDKAAPRP